MTTLVSVIIPTYGRPELVQRAIESVEAQTYDDLQIHLIETPTDEGHESTDILRFDVPIDHVVTESDVAATAARNIGIERAEGKYLAFLDDNDCWEPTKVQRQVEQLDETPSSVKASVTGHRKVDSTGETINEVVINNHEDWVKRGIGGSIGTFSMIMVEREAAVAVGGLDENLLVYEDHDFTLRLAKSGVEFGVIDDLLVNKGTGEHDQLGGNYDAKIRASSIFQEKHGEIAMKYNYPNGLSGYFELHAGRAARNDGRYFTALRHFAKCLAITWSRRAGFELLATLGGPVSYRAAQYIHRKILRGTRDK